MNPSQSEIRDLLAASEIIAVVGLSRHPLKPSRTVPEYLKEHGYRIIPINPHVDELMGEKAYASLQDIPEELAAQIDLVDIFRPSKDLPEVVREALESIPNVKGIWAQLGIVNEEAADTARRAGVMMVQDRCIRTDHRMLKITKAL